MKQYHIPHKTFALKSGNYPWLIENKRFVLKLKKWCIYIIYILDISFIVKCYYQQKKFAVF